VSVADAPDVHAHDASSLECGSLWLTEYGL